MSSKEWKKARQQKDLAIRRQISASLRGLCKRVPPAYAGEHERRIVAKRDEVQAKLEQLRAKGGER